MPIACRFARRGMLVAPRRLTAPGGPVSRVEGSTAGSGGDRSGGRDPIVELLAELRGRAVTLQVGQRLLTGRLILADPVVIVDGQGRATCARPEAVVAVTF
ncbi:hypothetical protein [Symbiobacterium thermophilum]|uniref:Uncharacterized protein n=1 Tax=Symbiobacterium thermophilum (strain DSM 24528 / JCM 14929 / IAM 14863 / T) TaxID=292459 RepID=Q67QQ1_SYMTH|nr:hypothetical protein [Symbiobacterium thermophilum]BAD39992.1 hypothetical protein STH1007 [Symbiobacterium thermophilum IAM 14863]